MEIVSVDPPVSQNKIEALLTEFDAEFDPRLSKRVNMQDYAKKNWHRMRFGFWCMNRM